MKSEQIETTKNNILNLLREKRLAEAFSSLKTLVEETSDWHISEKLSELEQSYRYMIHYVAEGIDDPKRDDIYENIIAETIKLCETATNELIARTSTKLYYATLRTERMHPENTEAILARRKRALDKIAVFDELPDSDKDEATEQALLHDKENINFALFRRLWTAFPISSDDFKAVKELFSETSCDTEAQEIAVNAIMLNLLEHYNETLLLLLLDIYADEKIDSQLQIKSLCCALIVMHRYPDMVALSRQVRLRFASLSENPRTETDIVTIFLQFIRSRGTERISRKVREELVPQLMKLKPEIRRKMQAMDFDDDMEKNPDWQEMLDKSGITEKMQELNQMQIEGNDVFLSSFARLKNFPFFAEISNWFLPFTPRHSSFFTIFPPKSPLKAIIGHSDVFCDSDKYSFALSVAAVPQQQRDMMLQQFDEQNAQFAETFGNGDIPAPEKARENTANKYVQNLYRFFNLFRRKSEFYNPFGTTLNLMQVPFVCEILSDTRNLKLIAEFYFKQEYYADALSIFEQITASGNADVSIYQKTGFCHESLKQYAKAAEAYDKAELSKNDDIWTLKHIALCLKANGEPEKALEYYRRIEKMQPDNIAVANNIGNCLLDAGNPEEALQYFYKVDYMADKGTRTLRPLAWCTFLTGRYEQSAEYYGRIIADSPTPDDYINRGHALLASKHTKEAVDDYRKAASQIGVDKVAATMEADSRYLSAAEIDNSLLHMIIDKLHYDLA